MGCFRFLLRQLDVNATDRAIPQVDKSTQLGYYGDTDAALRGCHHLRSSLGPIWSEVDLCHQQRSLHHYRDGHGILQYLPTIPGLPRGKIIFSDYEYSALFTC